MRVFINSNSIITQDDTYNININIDNNIYNIIINKTTTLLKLYEKIRATCVKNKMEDFTYKYNKNSVIITEKYWNISDILELYLNNQKIPETSTIIIEQYLAKEYKKHDMLKENDYLSICKTQLTTGFSILCLFTSVIKIFC
jgi:PHD/YefM family antitoxin component YafN of YafNO toxin-antitoxin module